MKKILILAVLVAFSSFKSFSQSYVVTPSGFRDSTDTAKTYIVLKAEGKTAKELYENALRYINKAYKNPSSVIQSKTENEYVRIDGFAEGLTKEKVPLMKIPIDAKYTIELTFKDGKVKFEITDIDMYNTNNKYIKLMFQGGGMSNYFIYNKDGNLKREAAKADIEQYFRTISTDLTTYLKGAGQAANSDF